MDITFDIKEINVKIVEDKKEETIEDENILLEDRLKKHNEMTRRVKMICLNEMKKNILIPIYSLSDEEKKILQQKMWEYNDVDEKEIIDKFNAICVKELFNDKIDYSTLPIYNI